MKATVKSNKVFLSVMTALLLVVGFSGIILGLKGEEPFSSWYVITFCVLMIFVSGFSFYLMRFCVMIEQDQLIVKQWTTKTIPIKEIKYIDFSFAINKNGSYFVALKNGDGLFLVRRVFSSMLSVVLRELCRQNQIEVVDKPVSKS